MNFRKTIGIGFAIITLAVWSMGFAETSMAMENVTVGISSLKIGGFAQFYMTFNDDDGGNDEFDLKRARLLLSGTIVPDKVKFFVQADGTGSPYVLDSKLILTVIPNTSILMGRYLPNFSMYMPYLPAKLPMINYPLTTAKYAMWRQTGLESITKTQYVDFTLGVFNGYQYNSATGKFDGNDWGDDNDAKDFLARVDIKPVEGLRIGLFGWKGNPYCEELDDDFDADRYGANIQFDKNGFHFAAEYIHGSDDYLEAETIDSEAYFGELFYSFNESWQILARYDYYDSDTDVDDNAEEWYSGGINYFLEKWNVRFAANYIIKDEEGIEIDNDQIVLMAQYMF